MMKSSGGQLQEKIGMRSRGPELDIKKLGIVSRDYNHRFPDGSYDFSSTLRKVLEILDKEKCDAVLFSLYSINSGKPFDLETALNGLKRIKAVFLEEFEEFEDGSWSAIRNVVHHRLNGKWNEYEVYQAFGSLTGLSQKNILSFVKEEIPKRILGNCCLLLCGESNGVKYSRTDKKVNDTFGLRAAIPHGVNIVLNPVHDRMTRFEMNIKRQFLSKKGRWVVSVWNKGKEDGNGTIRNFRGPEWKVFHNGIEKNIDPIPNVLNELGVEIGILDITKK
jgi:hypothetical protein